MSKLEGRSSRLDAFLREQIVSGRWKAGFQIPTRAELAAKFKVTPPSIQAVIRRLTDDGFIYSRSTNGTFVADELPHLTRYGFYFPQDWTDGPLRSLFWVALRQAAQEISLSGPRRVPFYNYSGVAHEQTAACHAELAEDLASHRLAGLILTSELPRSLQDLLSQRPRIKTVDLAQESTGKRAKVDLGPYWLDDALTALAKKNRKRVAFVCELGAEYDALAARSAHFGFKTPRSWVLGVHRGDYRAICNVVHLLMSGSAEQRPDAVLVMDDNVVSGVVGGLIAAGIRIPDDADVIAHANFPAVEPLSLPIQRVGYSAHAVLHSCMDVIDRQRRGERTPGITLTPPVFEYELTKARPLGYSGVASNR